MLGTDTKRRITHTHGYTAGTGTLSSLTATSESSPILTYTPNALNQYSNITTEGGRFILGERAERLTLVQRQSR